MIKNRRSHSIQIIKSLFVAAICVSCLADLRSQRNIVSRELQFKFSPFRLTNGINAGIELAVEVKAGKKFSTQFAGIFLRDLLHATIFQSLSGYRLAMEEKYFPVEPEGNFHPYLSGELAYCNAKIRSVEYFDDDGTNSLSASYSKTYLDSITIHKQTACLNFKMGVQWKKGRCVLDFGCGIGIMYKDVFYTNQMHPENEHSRTLEPNMHLISSKAGSYFVPNLPMSFRIGYTFR